MSAPAVPDTSANANASLVLDRQAQADRGERTAYVSDEGSMTYLELLAASARAGNLLRDLGVRREERILLVLDDTLLFPTAFLGAMRIGAVPVPVSLREHAENFRHFIGDSYARFVICEPAMLDALRAALAGLPVQLLARGGHDGAVELDSAMAAQDAELSPVDTHPDDMAFWLYTSGSTGRPKGVVHVHKTIPLTCEAFARNVMELTEDDRIFSSTKLYHSYGLGNTLAYPLHFGASAVLMSGPPTPERLVATLREHRPTVYCSVPALYRQLLADPGTGPARESVRCCISAAEPLPVRTFESWRERFGQEILDGIGATEMFVSFCSNVPGDVAPGTTGRPIPGYELRLLDEHGHEVRGAGEGALQVKGGSRAACYWHQQERTRRAMQGEWLATGDRFRRRPDGRYEYVGRVDDMLKVGGLWVSPVDMEHVLIEHPGVGGAAVVGASVEDYTRLVAFVQATGEQDEQQLTAELRELCAERLREHEQPHLIRFVTELPRTANGKPRRFKLREQVEAELAADAPGRSQERQQPPASPPGLAELAPAQRERAVLELVRDETARVLACEPRAIDVQRRFVQMGLDSLMAVELRNRLAAASGQQLPSTLAFDHPTPATAARALLAAIEGRSEPPASSAAERESLLELEQPMARTRMPPARLSIRLNTSTVVQSLLPPRLAVARAERRAGAVWEQNQEVREEALAAMRAVVSGTERAAELERLARRHVTERMVDRALFWQRPWTAGIDETSMQRVQEALDSDRGVLLSSCHIGPYYRLEQASPFRGRTTYLVPGPWFFDEPSHDLWGRRLARWRNGTASRPVRATGSFRVIQALLENGGAVFLFFDVPGPRQTRFLGKPAMLAEGTALLSARTGALILPVRARRDGHRVLVEAGRALDPAEHAGPDRLHEALAAQQERWILEDPAAMEDPREIGWRDGAKPEAWIVPAPS